jgi:hypothetical protein
MKILNQDFSTITFDDIVAHCGEKHPEGVQLDYKENYPQKDLSKLFAAFSNTRGGLIIIGVKENRTTGIPETWNGIVIDATLVERVHQQALSVTPLPSYQVRMTDEKSGMIFLLIRIDEGASTPYFVKNDANVWVRTGNIRNPIGIAEPEWLELLYKKRSRAEKARKNYFSVAETVFKSGLELEEKKRLRLIEEAKSKGDGSEKTYAQNKLGTEVEPCTITIQPFYPSKAMIRPLEIIDKARDFRIQNNYCDFPDLNLRPIPEGAMMFKHGHNGYIECQQLYSSGLFYYRFDVKTFDRQSSKPVIYCSYILGSLATILLSSKSFYSLVGYQGVVKLNLELEIKDRNVYFCRLTGNDPFFFDAYQEALLPKYNWEYTFNTSELGDQNELMKLYCQIADDIHWSFGYKGVSVAIVQKFLADNQINL